MFAYLRRVGIEMDILLNVTSGGASGEPISLRSAKADAAHKVWGCVLCRWLSWSVEKDHCAKVLAGVTTTPGRASAMAGLQILVLFILVFGSWEFLF